MICRLRKKLILICAVSILLVLGIVFSMVLGISTFCFNETMNKTIENVEKNEELYKVNIEIEVLQDESMEVLTEEQLMFNWDFFSVYIDDEGNVISTDVDEDASVDREKAETYAATVYDTNKDEGWLYGYRYRTTIDNGVTKILFLNANKEILIKNMLLICFGIVLVIMGTILFFLITIFSRRAVYPIAESYEKQKQFVTDVNHELRTPLTLIMTNVEILENDYGKNEWIDDIKSEGRRMHKLIDQLVLLARMDEEGEKLQSDNFCISVVLMETVNDFKESASKKGEKFVTQINKNIEYNGDKDSIRRLFRILLDNAVKYCEEDGDIFISLKGNKYPQICIENAYNRVNELELTKLFDRFYRFDKARTYTGGFGIGLSIAKMIVKDHNGDICAYKKDDLHIGFKIILR